MKQQQQLFLFSYFLLLQEKVKHLFSATGSGGGADGCITMETLALPCWEDGDAGERERKRHDDNNNKTNNNIFSTRSEPPDRCLGFSNRPHFFSPKPRN